MDEMNKEWSYIKGTIGDIAFVMTPKELIKSPRYKNVSAVAKLLYGLLLDRTHLSVMNGWLDENGRYYVYYSVDSAAEDLCCERKKVMRLFNELADNDLIKKVKQKNGRANRIYVRDPESLFESLDGTGCPVDNIVDKAVPKWDSGIEAVDKAVPEKDWPVEKQSHPGTGNPSQIGTGLNSSSPILSTNQSHPGTRRVPFWDPNNTEYNNKDNNTSLEKKVDLTAKEKLLPEEKKKLVEKFGAEVVEQVLNTLKVAMNRSDQYIWIAGVMKPLATIKKMIEQATTEQLEQTMIYLSKRTSKPLDMFQTVLELFYLAAKDNTKSA